MDLNTAEEPVGGSEEPHHHRPRSPAAHLRVEEAVSYIDRTATRRARAHLERHLVRCDLCLREVVQVVLFLYDLEGGAAGRPHA